jgi:hypothetical protein
MRDVIGYVVAAIAAALIATVAIGLGAGTPFLVRALAFPDFVGALSPGIAITGRRMAGMVSGGGYLVAAPFVALGATVFFLLVDLVGLALFRATDSAWTGETFWEKGKAGFGAVIFAVTAAAVFLIEEMIGGPFAYLKLDVGVVMASAGVGGLVFGLLQPSALRDRWAIPTTTAADVGSIRKSRGSLAR